MGAITAFRKLSVYIILSVAAIATVAPFLWIVITSLRTKDEIMAEGPLKLPSLIHWENYTRIWSVGNFLVYFKNSVIVTFIVVILIVLFSLLAGYAFSFLKFRGKETLLLLVLLGLMVPAELIIIPLYHNLLAVGLLDTLWAIILPQIALGIPFAIFILRGFMKEIPLALLESSRLDGSSEFNNLLYIIIPLSVPAVISVTIFTAIGAWNNFIFPTVLIQNDAMRTLPVGLNYFIGKFTIDYSMIATAANISALPAVVVYLLLQRRFISGMMVGALKE